MCNEATEEKIKAILDQTFLGAGYKDTSIRNNHMRTFLTIILEGMETKDWSVLKSVASFKLGLSERKIQEYMRGLVASEVFIIDDNGKITYNEVK